MSPMVPITWATIRTYFTDVDVDHMQQQGLDLSDYDTVVANANAILAATSAQPPRMPPPGSGQPPWTPEQIDGFRSWMNAGYPK